jgi:ERCC4-type nuclease
MIEDTTAISFLPALRCLGNLADMQPVVVIDTREQDPLPFSRLAAERGTLATGDYSIRGAEELFAIERKTIADLLACCVGENRERFFRELHRLRGYRFKRLLVVGTRDQIETGDFRSNVSPKAVLATLAALEARFDVPVVFSPSPVEAARRIVSWAFWFARELVEATNELARAHGLTRRTSTVSRTTPPTKSAICRAGSINTAASPRSR